MSAICDKAGRAADAGLAGCHVCGKVSEVALGHCPRCGSHLHLRKPHSLQRTMALLVAAAALYLPAMVLPMLSVRELGVLTESTILEGMITFWQTGAYPIAIVIFTASILIPVLKIGALLWLCAAAAGKIRYSPGVLGRVYWITELLGRWSMVDIFVVAILVTMVQLGNYMSVTAGPGAIAFGSMVILTMFSAMCFDPKLLWDQLARAATGPIAKGIPASE